MLLIPSYRSGSYVFMQYIVASVQPCIFGIASGPEVPFVKGNCRVRHNQAKRALLSNRSRSCRRRGCVRRTACWRRETSILTTVGEKTKSVGPANGRGLSGNGSMCSGLSIWVPNHRTDVWQCLLPRHLPPDTKNVPTFRSNFMSPMTAQLQLDHVFASRGFHESIQTRALNCVCQWGSSDHCRIVIDVKG